MLSQIIKLFEQVHKIPLIPEIVQILINQLNDPAIDMKAIAENVEKEQVISLKVLRLVNSAAFGLPKKVASIDEAVVLLGMGKLRTLVIASGIVNSVPEIENFDVKQFWLDSFGTANYAKWLANEAQCDAEIAFTVGLISGLGSILIRLGLPKVAVDIDQHLDEGHARPFVEKMRLGFTSQDVCAELCKLWKFSDDLIIPVSQCAEPMKAEPISKIACIIFIAGYLNNCKQENMPEEEILQSIPYDVVEQLELPDTFFKQKLTEILALESGLDGLLN
jgi:HD-like signal output (HDOD) protein